MSHFVVLAIVPKGETDIDEAVRELLEPYDEHTRVPPYDKRCYCAGQIARREAKVAAEKECGTPEHFQAKVDEALPLTAHDKDWAEGTHEKRQALWEELTAPLWAAEGRIFSQHPMKDVPDSACDQCNGSGFYLSTYSQAAKWDWWRIGGRWDGWLCELEPNDDGQGGFNFGEEFTSPERNARPTAEVIARIEAGASLVPFAIVSERGWVEKGAMGWWGMVTDAKPEAPWRDQVLGVLRQFPDSVAVAVDCHI